MKRKRNTLVGLAVTAVSLGATLAGCEEKKELNAPPWVFDLARQEATRLDEQSPRIDFAACGPAACILRKLGSFRDSHSRAASVGLEISLHSHSIVDRQF